MLSGKGARNHSSTAGPAVFSLVYFSVDDTNITIISFNSRSALHVAVTFRRVCIVIFDLALSFSLYYYRIVLASRAKLACMYECFPFSQQKFHGGAL